MDNTAQYYSGPSDRFVGGSLPYTVYSGSRRLRGGGIFGALGRLLGPAVKSFGRKILKQGAQAALDMTQNVVNDVASGKNLGESLKTHGKRGLQRMGKYALNEGMSRARRGLRRMQGSGLRGRRRKSLRKRKSRKRLTGNFSRKFKRTSARKGKRRRRTKGRALF